MTDTLLLARAYHAMMAAFVADGRAPHYTELAVRLGVRPIDALQLQRALAASGLPVWLYPDTDHVAAMSPFSSLPTPYRVSVEGHQRWYALWGLDSLAVRWLFPRKEVQVDARCLDCAEPLRLRMRDETLLAASPATIVGHANLPAPRWHRNWAFTWNGMNLFRSEEHARRWPGYEPAAAAGTLPLEEWAYVFSVEFCRRRLEPDFFLHGLELRQGLFQALKDLGKSGPFWGTAAE